MCVGKPLSLSSTADLTSAQTQQARRFLNLPVKDAEEEGEEVGGCGAEYGRHSRSIDTARVRCGRCRGGLELVRGPGVGKGKKGGKKEEEEEEEEGGLIGLEERMGRVKLRG